MSSWIFVLYALGLLFLLVEIFVPGAVVGTIGVILLLAASYGAAQELGPIYAGIIFLGCVGLAVASFIAFFRSPMRKLIVLESDEDSTSEVQEMEVGLIGTTTTELRPSGKASFVLNSREKQVDVLTNAEFIERDQRVQITKVEGNRVFVVGL